MNTQEHALRQYDQELDSLRSHVMEMGGLVESQINAAMRCLEHGDLNEIDEVIDNDHRVNHMEVVIDKNCAQVIARRQPTANDLRLIQAISKLVTDLERIGDEAAKIARYASYMHERGRFFHLTDVSSVGQAALAAVRKSLDAFTRHDVTSAQKIIDSDYKIDNKFGSIIRQLITFVMEDPRTIGVTLDYMMIAKALERIGDHAKNISEYVIYIVHGTDVRHVASSPSKGKNTDAE